MGRHIVSFPFFAALLVACMLVAGLAATPTIGAGDQGAGAAKRKHKKGYAPIRGKLSKPGYTLIALADNGRATSVRVRGRRFKLRPPARAVTLQLRAPRGTYAGPVVVGVVKEKKGTKTRKKAKGKRVIVGVKAGTNLGKVTVKPTKGYARVKRRLGAKWIDAKRWAQASSKGVPIGNGQNVGLVRSKMYAPAADPADPDRDGVPNSLDVDDNGNLILDAADHSTGTNAKKSSVVRGPNGILPFISASTNLPTSLEHGTVNVDGGSSDQEIAATLQSNERLEIGWNNIDPGSGELDCGEPQGSVNPGLPYCSAGGTGRVQTSWEQNGRALATGFPECCDPDGDGFGAFTEMQGNPGSFGPGSGTMRLYPGATQDEIHAGDVLIMHATASGVPLQAATTVGYVASTQPAIASYDDGQGDSGTFTYHGEGGGPAVRPVRAGPGGDVVVSIRFWRPQRPAIGGEPSENGWIDIGKLWYLTHVLNGPPGSGRDCPQSSYLEVDPSLAPVTAPPPFVAGGAVFVDSKEDEPSQPGNYPANTLTLTVDLTQCLAATGGPTTDGPYELSINALYLNPDGGLAMSTSVVDLQPQP